MSSVWVRGCTPLFQVEMTKLKHPTRVIFPYSPQSYLDQLQIYHKCWAQVPRSLRPRIMSEIVGWIGNQRRGLCFLTLGVRVPGCQWEHAGYIAGIETLCPAFAQQEYPIHIWSVIWLCAPNVPIGNISSIVSGTIAPFTHFSLFSPLFCPLTHIILSWPVTILFILIFHPLLYACICDIQPARRVSFFSLFSDHVIDHLITMCLSYGFIVTDLIAPSQLVPFLVSMFVLCWKPNMVCAQCTFSTYSLPFPWGFSSLKSQSFPQVCFPLCFSLPYAHQQNCLWLLTLLALLALFVRFDHLFFLLPTLGCTSEYFECFWNISGTFRILWVLTKAHSEVHVSGIGSMFLR